MTVINWVFVLVLSGLLAMGSWGIGKGTFREPPAAVQGYRPSHVLEEELFKGGRYPSRTSRGADDAGLSQAKDLIGQVSKEFDKLSSEVGKRVAKWVVWDEVVKDPGNLKGVLAELKKQAPSGAEDSAFQQLKDKLADPKVSFKVAPLPPEFLANVLVPGKGDDFAAEVDGKRVDFVWVDKAGCWIAAEETPDKPTQVRLGGVAGDISCQSPTEQQWQAASTVTAIKNLDGGKAEYLRDKRVIGKSFRVQDDAYDKPMDEDSRKKQTINKSAIAITPASPEVVRYMDAWKKQNPSKSQAEFNVARQGIMRELSEEQFAYRWVIEPPLKPALPPAPSP